MAEPHVLSALYAKYALLMGALHQCEGQSETLRCDLHHIEATIRLFKPDWTGEGIKPRKAHKPQRWSRRGQGVKTALAVLREATAPLSTREITVRVIERLNMPEPPYDELKLICASLNGALTNRAGRGITLNPGHPKRWSITPPAANTQPMPVIDAMP